jgi:hypothetical protein
MDMSIKNPEAASINNEKKNHKFTFRALKDEL